MAEPRRLDPMVELALRTWAKGASISSLVRLLQALQEELRERQITLQYDLQVQGPSPSA